MGWRSGVSRTCSMVCGDGVSVWFFFFQAEDGIRDLTVTGVQTCALPIYGKKASKKVEKAMHERKKGTLKSGRSGKKVKSRKQAIAIGLSEARRSGAKVPRKKSSSKKRSSKKSSKRK